MKRSAGATKGHGLCRPPSGARDVERWTPDGWIADDGEPVYAFSFTFTYETMCISTPYSGATGCGHFGVDCMKRIAAKRTTERFSASNGVDLRRIAKNNAKGKAA